jgi:transposase-like protein
MGGKNGHGTFAACNVPPSEYQPSGTRRAHTLAALNNRLEADHAALKRLINPTRGFKTLPTASATIEGFEVMRMIRKRQCLMLESGSRGEVHFVHRLFRLAA